MAFKPYVPPSTTTGGWGSPTKLEQGWSSGGTQATATTNLPDFMRPDGYNPVQQEYKAPVQEPVQKMTFGENLSYIAQKGLKGVAQTVANVAEVPDQAFRLVSLGIGSIYNPIAKAVGGKELDWNKTFTQATRDADAAIDKAVASISFKEKEKESESKFEQALAKFENFRQQSIGEYFQKEANKLGTALAPQEQRVGKGWKFAGDVVESMPTTASFRNPIVGSAGILAGSVRDNATAQGKSFNDAKLAKEISYAISSGAISGLVESSFGVFDEVASLLKVGQKAFPTLKDVIGTIFRAGAGEGAEELVEYPIQQFLDWRYNNADKPVSDYLTKEKLNEWGRGAAIGFVSGGIFGIGGAVKAKNTFTPAEKATIDILARDYLNKPVNELTVADVNRVLTVYGNIATQDNPDVFESLREAEADIKGEPYVAKTSESIAEPVQALGSDSTTETANIITNDVQSVTSAVAEPTMASDGKALEESAKSAFGLTKDLREAGYVLSSGELLDFSGKNDGGEPMQRSMDHRDVNSVMNESGTDAMNKFLFETGSLRTSYNDGNANYEAVGNKALTQKQITMITKSVRSSKSIALEYYTNETDRTPIYSKVIETPSVKQVMEAITEIKNLQQPTAQPAPQPTIAKKETVAPKRTLSQAIDDIVATATSESEAKEMFKDELRSNPNILNDLKKDIKDQGTLAVKLIELKKQMDTNDIFLKPITKWKMNLQLLAHQSLLEILEAGEPNMIQRRFIKNLLKYTEMSDRERMTANAENMFRTADLFYERKYSADAIEDFHNKYEIKNFSGTLMQELVSDFFNHPDVVRSPAETIALIEYGSKLAASESDTENTQGHMILSSATRLMTSSGQMIQALNTAYNMIFPERMVKGWEDSFNKRGENQNPIDAVEVDKKTEETIKEVQKIHKKAKDTVIDEVANPTETDVTKAAKKARQKKAPKEKLSPAEIFEQWVVDQSNPKSDPKVATAVQKMLANMKKIYLELNPKSKKDSNVYETATWLIFNRKTQAETWNKTKELLIENDEVKAEMQDFMDRLADPVLTKSLMNAVIAEAVKDMNVTSYQRIRDFALTDGESFEDVVELLRQAMPTLAQDTEAFEYLADSLRERFKQQTEDGIKKYVERMGLNEIKRNIAGKETKQSESRRRFATQLMDLAAFDKLQFPRIREMWAERLGVPMVTEAMREKMYEAAKKLSKSDNKDVQNKIVEELMIELEKDVPASFKEKWLAWTRFSLLATPGTLIQNMTSNIIMQKTMRIKYRVEAKLAETMKKHIPEFMRKSGSKVITTGEKPHLDTMVSPYEDQQVMDDLLAQTSTAKHQVTSHENRKLSDVAWIDTSIKALYNVMNTGFIKEGSKIGSKYLGDSYAFGNSFRFALLNKLDAMGITAEMVATYKETGSEPHIDKVLPDALKAATQEGLKNTFRLHGLITERLTSLKHSPDTSRKIRELARNGHTGQAQTLLAATNAVNLLIDSWAKFVPTPVAIGVEAYKFSPINFAVSLGRLGFWKIATTTKNEKMMKYVKADTVASIVDNLAQSSVGTVGQFAIGLIGGFLGVLTGAPPDDPDEKKRWLAQGKRAYSLYIPGVGSFSINWLQPMAMNINLGAEIGQMIATGESDIENLGDVVSFTINSLFANSVFESMADPLTGYNGSIGGALSQIVGGMPFQAMPRMLQKLTRFIDPYERDIYKGTSTRIMVNRILSYAPIGFFLIPPKIDMWGQPIKKVNLPAGADYLASFVLEFIAPMKANFNDMDAVTKEFVRVANATGNTDANPKIARDTFTMDKIPYTLDGAEWVNFQRRFGQLQHEYALDVIDDDRYKNATDDKKAEYLKKAYESASEQAKKEYVKQYKANTANP